MTARLVFSYAVCLMVGVLVGFALADGPAGRQVLVVPAICALLIGLVAAGGTFLSGRPTLRRLILRIGGTLPLIVAAALAMRAIRLGEVMRNQAAVEAAWQLDVERGFAAGTEAGRAMYLSLRELPAESLSDVRTLLWILVALSVCFLLALQYARFSRGSS